MKSFKSKILAILIVYFAGFSTAIYGLAPVDQSYALNDGRESENIFCSFTKSDRFANGYGQKLHQWSDLAEVAAEKAGNFIQQKVAAKELSNVGIANVSGVESDGVEGQ